MEYFYLKVIKGVEKGKQFLVEDGATSIGRSSSNSIAFHSSEKTVSSHHAIIYKSADKIVIQDMRSTNGTYLNDKKIQEGDIQANDIIGFGQKGPKLKCIISNIELSTAPIQVNTPKEDTGAQTIDHNDNKTNKMSSTGPADSSTHTDDSSISKISSRIDQDIPFASSVTLDIEKKLIKSQIEADDMHSLMKNKNRVEKILDRGNLSEAQSSILASAYGAGKKAHKQWIFIVSIVATVSLVIILFLTIRMYQYKKVLSKGLSLEDKLDTYELKIFQANRNPEMNKKELAKLIIELEQTKKELSLVKENLNDKDVSKFYADDTERYIADIMKRFGETDYHIPPKMVERVKYHISIYSGRLKKTIGRYLDRKNVYFPMIRKIFSDKKLPIELAYVSMLESGFNPKALSHAGARGLWQFMPRTGRSFGLKVNKSIDERCNPKMATYAAAEYFKDLIGIFGGKSSVMLAMAAYNAGEGRVMGALRKIDDPMRNRDFWYIYRMGYLAEETNEYIPRILALMIIDEHPSEFGFTANGTETPKTPKVEKEDDFIELEF